MATPSPASPTKKSVRFNITDDGREDSPQKIRRTGRPPVSTRGKKDSPTRVVVGKAQPLRDLAIFVAIMGLLVYSFSGTSKKNSKKERAPPSTDPVADTIKAIAEALATKRSEPCQTFVDRSTIPRNGWSLFAGESFDAGDTVVRMEESPAAISSGQLHPVFHLLKHHPILFNVKIVTKKEGSISEEVGSDSSFRLVATRPIAPADELFISSLNSSNLHYNNTMPHTEDYQLAWEIVQDSMTVAKIPSLPKNRRRVKVASPGMIYGLLRRSMARVNVRTANLLPASPSDAYHISEAMRELPSSSLAFLQNTTLDKLRAQGTCLQDVVAGTSDSLSTRTTKAFRKGQIVSYIPIMATSRELRDEECSATEQSNCFPVVSQNNVRLCPILPFPIIESTNNGTGSSNTDHGHKANVQWKWHYSTKLNEIATTEDRLSFLPQEWLVLQVVAIQDIPDGSRVGNLSLFLEAISHLCVAALCDG